MPESPAGVVVLGQRGLTRDVVRHALSLGGIPAVDLVALSEDTDAPVIVVLVSPAEEDWLQAEQLRARVVVVSDCRSDPGAAVDMLVRGADAVVDCDAELDALVQIISTVAEGDAYLTPRQAAEAIERLRRTPVVPAGLPALTPRELDILVSIDRGDVVKQTARQLAISEKTVQNIQSRLFRKLGARNRAQAVARAHEIGFLPVSVNSVRE